MKMLRSYLSVSAIIGVLPNQIINGQLIDAVPVMADLNFIVNQVNSNVPPLIPVVTQSIIFVPTASVGGTGNAITLAPTPTLGAYAAGVSYRFPAGAVNTGAVQVNVSGLGNQAIVNGGSGAALTGGELQAGGIYDICYNGAAFELINTSQTSAIVNFTPTLTFGGASVGLTYSQQIGRYIKVGSLVIFSIYIALSAKGTSTGNVSIGGLPFPSSINWPTSGVLPITMYQQAMTYTSGNMIYPYITPNTSSVVFEVASPGGAFSILADGAFNSSTIVALNGTYST